MSTNTRKLHIKAFSFPHFIDILASLKNALEISPYTAIHKYDSFAPVRNNAQCTFFVDGESYFS
jgi:hypothetical protein